MSQFRINYNGQQVSRTFGSYAEAKREIIAQADYSARIGQSAGAMWLQEYIGGGEWSGAGMSIAKRRPHEHR